MPLLLATFAFLVIMLVGVRYGRHVGELRNRTASYEAVLRAYAPQFRLPQRPPRRMATHTVLDRVADRLIFDRYRDILRQRLVRMGRQDVVAYRALARRKVVGLVLGLTYGAAIVFDGSLSGYVQLMLCAGAGFMVPDVLVYNTTTKRSTELERALPDAIDVMNLCVEAGVTFQVSLSQVASVMKGPVAEEFSRVLRQMQLGQSMVASLQDMADRNDNEDLERFVHVISQTERLGIPIAGVLSEQARTLRGKRRDRAREQAQKVPVKILMPVMVCFLPGIFVIVLGPALVSIVRALSGM